MTKLFVICGHGAGDPGACRNGYQEAERVRVLGKRIKELGGDSVMLGDVNRNYYADAGINSLNISKDYQIIELHMDSSTAASARGAHVIIWGDFSADDYDKALAKFFSNLLPGRSSSIVGRKNLANPRRAANKGYAYRLVECGFISNAADVAIFNANIDTMAKGILECFGINAGGSTPEPTPAPAKKSVDEVAREILYSKNYGGWGKNPTRRQKLIAYGGEDFANSVQARINELCDAKATTTSAPKMTARQFALEVWVNGKHGTGATRKANAERLGLNYDEVRRLINILAKGGKI